MKKVTFLLTLLVLLCCGGMSVMAADLPNYSGRAHIQNVGWQDVASDGNHHLILGAPGQGLRLEAFTLQTDYPELGIRYQSHVQDIGWQGAVENGQASGTEGQRKKIEALCIQLTGANAPNFNLFYRTHVENYGWLDWTTNFGASGTTGHNFKCEAVEIVIYPKDQAAPGAMTTPAVQALGSGEARHMYLVNQLRKSHGLNYVTGDPNLQAVARLRATEIITRFSHTRPNDQSYETAVKTVFPNYRLNGGGFIENICQGALEMTSPDRTFDVYTHYAQDTDRLLQPNARYLSWAATTRGTMAYSVTLLSGLDRIDFAD